MGIPEPEAGHSWCRGQLWLQGHSPVGGLRRICRGEEEEAECRAGKWPPCNDGDHWYVLPGWPDGLYLGRLGTLHGLAAAMRHPRLRTHRCRRFFFFCFCWPLVREK